MPTKQQRIVRDTTLGKNIITGSKWESMKLQYQMIKNDSNDYIKNKKAGVL